MPPIGVFGGTFDPIHTGHLRLAEEMREALGLAEVRFVPAGRPPLRDAPHTPALHRLAMARLAVAGNPYFSVDERELRRDAPSYTVDTLTALRAELGEADDLWLLLGADAFRNLARWHRWQDLFGLARIAVATRPGSTIEAETLALPLRIETGARLADGRLRFIGMTPLAISATAIREALARSRSVRYLLPGAVLDYIQENRLYA